MKKANIFVGMDVHEELIVTAALDEETRQIEYRRFGCDYPSLRKYLSKLQDHGEVVSCYEAGGCGFWLHRKLELDGLKNYVIAPTLVPKHPGNRRKSDQIDAARLARNLSNGDLTPVRIPTDEEEQVRGLVRCREAFVRDVQRTMNRILKFLQLRGVRYGKGKRWTVKHRNWLRTVNLSERDREVLNRHLNLLWYLEEEVKQLDKEIRVVSEQDAFYRKRTNALMALRGLDVAGSMVLVTEIGDARRFANGEKAMGYTGLVPSLWETGGHRDGGPITRAGNERIRRVLLQAGWNARHKPTLGGAVGKRLKATGADGKRRQFSLKAQQRLYKKYHRLAVKSNKLAVTAVARELMGFVWAALVDVEQQLASAK